MKRLIGIFSLVICLMGMVWSEASAESNPIDLSCSLGTSANLYTTDLEVDNGGWVSNSSVKDWEWGQIVPNAFEQCNLWLPEDPPRAFSGDGVWATNLDGCYSNSGSITTLSRTFDLSTLFSSVVLSWQDWHSVFLPHDSAEIYVNNTLLWSADAPNPSVDWQLETIDLSAYAGQSAVTVEFRFTASTQTNRMGWYIDDISVDYCKLPDVVMTQTVGTDPAVCATTDAIAVMAGTDVTYCYQATNYSPLVMTQHYLIGSQLLLISNDTQVSPGESLIFTRTVRVEETTVSAETWRMGDNSSTFFASTVEAAQVTVLQPALDFVATVGTDPTTCATTDTVTVPLSTTVHVCYQVTNTGDTGFETQLTISDTVLGMLAPQETVTITRPIEVMGTGVISAEAIAIHPLFTLTATDFVSLTVPQTSLELTQTVSLSSDPCGAETIIAVNENSEVAYCYQIRNTGEYTLTTHLLETPFGSQTYTQTVAPGDLIVITETATITQAQGMSATWTANAPVNLLPATASGAVSVTIRPAAIDLYVTVGTDATTCATSESITVVEGTEVTYCYHTVNIGGRILQLNTLTDTVVGAIYEGSSQMLVPSETVKILQTVLITRTTLNTALWTTQTPNGDALISPALVTVNATAPLLGCNSPQINFESGIPSTWDVVDYAGGGVVWGDSAESTCNLDNHPQQNLTAGSGLAACVDSDSTTANTAYDTALISNPFDLPLGALSLSLDAYYRDIDTNYNDRFEVDIWDGARWHNQLSWDEDHERETLTLYLQDFQEMDDVQLRIRYSGDGFDWFAQVDNVALTCGLPTPTAITALTQQQSAPHAVLILLTTPFCALVIVTLSKMRLSE